MKSIAETIDTLDWDRIGTELHERGWATTGSLLSVQETASLTATYDDDTLVRSRVVMARHGFGRGEYRYYSYPLPELISSLRTSLYKQLVPIANDWRSRLGSADLFPAQHSDYLKRCHEAGQSRPTPLLLRYGEGDYNCLHQDLYGEHVFPLQAAFLLAEPGGDFEGGEFVLTEQRPRMQSRVHVVPLSHGEAVLFAVNERPVVGARGPYRVRMKHGVSPVRRGQRHTLGVIFHDAA
jgi:hypothetical protein